MDEHDQHEVARIAATLLHHREFVIEPHHIRHAVSTARLILDEAHRDTAPAPTE